MRQDFEFFIPIEKSGVEIDPETGDVLVDGPMSTVRKDLQGERVMEGAVASGLDTFIRLNMPVDWNHLSTRNPTPEEFDKNGAPIRFVMGNGVEVHDGPAPGGGITKYLKSRLYKGKKATQDCLEHLQAGGKLYYSIGGSAERDGDLIKRTNITHVAITQYPANPDCEIGLVGVGALAKSLGITDPAPLSPSSPSSPSDRFGDLLERFATRLEKVLSAGAGPGMGATGGRALGREDLEGGCSCGDKCGCDRQVKGDDTPDIHDTSDDPERGEPRKGKKTMSKVLDQETLDGLQALETDPKVGPIAKAMSAIASLFAKSKDDKSKDDEGDDDKEDSSAENEDDGYLGKGYEPFSGAHFSPFDAGDTIDVDLADFNKDLLKAMDARFARLEKAILGHVDDQMAQMNKAISAASEPSTELLKTLDQMGMRPRPTGGVSGAYQPAETGAVVRSKDQNRALLEKGARMGRLPYAAMTDYEIHGVLPEETLLKSLE